MKNCFIGIDNGTSGSIGFTGALVDFIKTPIKKELSYTKKKQFISRIDSPVLYSLMEDTRNAFSVHVLLERPLVNPRMFKTTMCAMRALEATLNILELLEIPYEYIDSKEWQKAMLPSGCKGSPELKKASLDIGTRMFPQFKDIIKKNKDADGILIAEYLKRRWSY